MVFGYISGPVGGAVGFESKERSMDKVVDQWLGESLGILELLERELTKEHTAVERAMAAVRHHTDQINRLERNIGIIRKALLDVESVHAVSLPIELFDAIDEGFGPELEIFDAGSLAGTPLAPLRIMPPPPPPPRPRAADSRSSPRASG